MNITDISANNANSNDKTKRMFSNNTNVNDEFILTSSNLKIWDMPEIRKTRDVYADAIWDVDNWDECNWDDVYDSGQVTADIINPNKNWRWLVTSLENTYWKHGSSDCIFDTGTSMTFSSGSSFISNRLTMSSGTISKATLTFNQNNNTNQSFLTFSLSANDGTNYEAVTVDSEHTFINPGRFLKLKILHGGGTTAQAILNIKDTQGVRTPVQLSYTT